MKFSSLTPKQKKVLDFVYSFTDKHGYSPSLNEIAQKFNKSTPTIHQYIETLKEKGFLRKESNISRGIKLNPAETEILLLGYIAAGKPIEPLENPEPIKISRNLIKGAGNYYGLRVRGDSMIDEGILNNDLVVIKHQLTAENGETIVSITENGATLKVFRKRNSRIYLEPRNKKLKNIYPKKLEIRGKFVGLIRSNN